MIVTRSVLFIIITNRMYDNTPQSVLFSYAEGEFGEFPKIPVTLSIMLLFGIMVLFGVKVFIYHCFLCFPSFHFFFLSFSSLFSLFFFFFFSFLIYVASGATCCVVRSCLLDVFPYLYEVLRNLKKSFN